MRLKHVAGLVFDQPLLLEPHKAEAIARYVAARMAGDGPLLAVQVDGSTRRDRQELDVVNGIAVIDVTGVLVHRPGQMDADSTPLLSYEQLAAELDAAVRSPEVRGIILRLDSPGGETDGAFDLADQVFAARQAKPVWAVAADLAASAGYLIASAAARLIVTQSATVGSIGVVLNRLDFTKALEAEGVRVIQIAAGARKLDGSPYQAFEDGSAEDQALRAHVATYYELFVNAVARNRGLDPAAVRATDAAIYVGAETVTRQLADAVGTLPGAIAELADLARPGFGAGLQTAARTWTSEDVQPTLAAVYAAKGTQAPGAESRPPCREEP